MKDDGVGGIVFAWSGKRPIIFDIDFAMGETAIESIGVMREFGLNPFEVSKPRTIGKFVEHPGGNKVG